MRLLRTPLSCPLIWLASFWHHPPVIPASSSLVATAMLQSVPVKLQTRLLGLLLCWSHLCHLPQAQLAAARDKGLHIAVQFSPNYSTRTDSLAYLHGSSQDSCPSGAGASSFIRTQWNPVISASMLTDSRETSGSTRYLTPSIATLQ